MSRHRERAGYAGESMRPGRYRYAHRVWTVHDDGRVSVRPLLALPVTRLDARAARAFPPAPAALKRATFERDDFATEADRASYDEIERRRQAEQARQEIDRDRSRDSNALAALERMADHEEEDTAA